MFKRPSKDDTEEDLLRFQAEFLASKTAPAVSVLKKPEKRKSDEEKTKQQHTERDVVSLGESVDMKKNQPQEKKVKFQKDGNSAADEDAEELLEKHDHHITKVLSQIVERDFKSPPIYFPSVPTHGGFPKVLHRGTDLQEQTCGQQPRKKQSLFAQQFLKSKGKGFGIATGDVKVPVLKDVRKRKVETDLIDGGKTIISGEGLGTNSPKKEAIHIHEENLQTLSDMSQDEIMKEQAELLQKLDPDLVQFIKNKRTHGESKSLITTMKPNTEQPDEEMENKTNLHDVQMETSENPTFSEDDLPIKPKKEWLNMKKIEYDKLEWTKTLDPPKAGDKSTGYTARFDFQGNLVPSDSDIPHHLGLHHHGNEPDKAGYTLEETFTLSRSTNMQQRSMALHILANIIKNARHGKFADCASTYIIPALLDGGLIFIMRWALDDSTDNTMVAAVNLLHTLLVCQEDECGLDQTFHWYQGYLVPRMCSQDPEQESYDEDGEKIQETDADVVKKDLIQGLLRMSIIPRLRFILQKWHPAASVVVQIVEILVRIARHSTFASYQITQCAGLIEILFKEFLPCHWNPIVGEDGSKPLSNVYGYPVPKALKLIRVICASSRNIALSMINKYNLMSVVARYLCDKVQDLQLYPGEALELCIEAYRTWQVCCSYGLAISSYESMYQVLMNRLQTLCSSSTVEYETETNSIGMCLLTLLEAIMQVAANVTFESAKQNAKQVNSLSTGESSTTMSLPPIDWSRVSGLSYAVIQCMQSELDKFTRIYFDKPYDLTYVASVVNFVGSYFSLVASQPGYSAVAVLNLLENLCDTCFLPCIKSNGFQLALRYLREKSVLLSKIKSKRGEVTVSLPEIGVLCGDYAEKCPALEETSSIQFIVAFSRIILGACKIHKGLVSKLLPYIVQHEEMLQYVRKVCLWQKKAPLAVNNFCKFENQLQYNLITMCRLVATEKKDLVDTKLYHQLALYLLMHLHQGGEHIAHSLLSTVIFNGDFLCDVSSGDLSSGKPLQESLKLEEEKYLQSATTEIIRKGQQDLIEDSLTHLRTVRNSYLQAVASLVSSLHQSRNRTLPNPLEVDMLQSGDIGQFLVPIDWPFLPLVDLYNKTVNRPTSTTSDKRDTKGTEEIVTNTLRWVYITECWRSGVLDSVSLTMKLSRLMCVFLAESDLFLNANIHGYLLSLLKIYCKPVNLERTNLEEKVPGLASFFDLYILLLHQYEAVSFGDPLFAGYVFLPQQQKHELKYRKSLWGEEIGVLESLTVPLDQMIIPIKTFLEPEEVNLGLLRLYFQALYSGTVTQYRNPLPYLIAVHHVNRFLYTQDNEHQKLKDAFIKQGSLCTNKNLKVHIFYYKLFNPDMQFGIELYTELPATRKKLLESKGITPNRFDRLSL